MIGNSFQFPRVPRRPRPNKAEGSTALSPQISESVSPGLRKPAEFWRPPTDWECLSDDLDNSRQGGRSFARTSRQLSHDDQATSSTGPTHMQRQIRRMEAANPKIILERIKEEWTEIDGDVTMCKELEFEKHLWMLTALRYLAKRSVSKPGAVVHQEEETALTTKASSVPSKVLSLFENQGKLR